MNIGDLLFTLGVDGSRLESDITREGEAAANKAGPKVGKTLGDRMSSGMKQGLTAIGASAGYLLTSAIETGATFEDQLRTINTVAGLTDDQLAKVGDDIQQLSRDTGKTTDDLTAGFYDLVSAGVPAADAIQVLRDSAVFATGALGTTGEAVDLVTSAMNAYGLEAKDSTRITDIFAKAVADGKVTAAELGASIANIAPIAASAGISLEEVSSGYALLTAKGVPAAQAATQMRSAISALLTPNAELNKLQKQTGINFAELAKEKGLAVALEEIRKATKGNSDQFARSLGSVEAFQFALATTGDNATAMADQIVETTEVSGLALDQYNEKSKSSVEQGKRLQATIATFLQDVGGGASTLAPFLMTLNALAPAMRGLISPAKLAGAALGGILGRVGAGAFGRLGSLASRIPLGPFRAVGTRIMAAIGSGIVGQAGAGIVADGVADAVGGSGATSKITAAARALGSKAGLSFATAAAAAAIAIPIVLGVAVFEFSQGKSKEQQDNLADAVEGIVTNGTLEGLQKARDEIAKRRAFASKGDWLGLDIDGTVKNYDALLAKLDAEIASKTPQLLDNFDRMGAGAGPALADGVESGAPEAVAAVTEMAQQAGAAFKDATAAAAFVAGGNIPHQTAAGMRAHRQIVFDAIDALGEAMKHQMTPWGQAARITGFLVGDQLQKGLHSTDPAVRRQAEETRQIAEERLAAIIAGSGEAGRKAGEALKKGLRSKNPAVRAEAQRIQEIVDRKLSEIAPKAGDAGADAGAAFMRQLRLQLARPVSVHVGVIGGGGVNDRGKNATGGWWPAGQPTWVNEHTAQSEMYVPSTSGRFVTHAEAIQAIDGAAGGGGTTYNIPVSVQGAVPVRTIRDVSNELRRLGDLGVLPPATIPPKYARREATRA